MRKKTECAIVYDFEKKERRWARVDNGEVVKVDIIPEEDLQEEAGL